MVCKAGSLQVSVETKMSKADDHIEIYIVVFKVEHKWAEESISLVSFKKNATLRPWF